jgi:hypothetical protein
MQFSSTDTQNLRRSRRGGIGNGALETLQQFVGGLINPIPLGRNLPPRHG